MMGFFGKSQKDQNVEQDHFHVGFDVASVVTKATADTFTRKASGVGGEIAYLDEGSRLYSEFIAAHSGGAVAQLIQTHKSTLAKDMADSARLIVIGGGSYDSFMGQEMALVKELLATNPKAPLSELLLIDVSNDFLAQSRRAAEEVSAQNKNKFAVRSIRADFKSIAGEPFDAILSEMKLAPRVGTKATVIMTGGTFANISDVSTMDSLPYHDIEVQMAKLGQFVDTGSTVMFDFFTQSGNREEYYNTDELKAFITNIPNIMAHYCVGLRDFRINDPSKEDGIFFDYNVKNYRNARLIAHQLVASQPQQASIVNGVVKGLTIENAYNVIYSLYPRMDDITSRPVSNTGLDIQGGVSSRDLAMVVARKVDSTVSAMDEREYYSVTDGANLAPAYAGDTGQGTIKGALMNFANMFTGGASPSAPVLVHTPSR